MNNLPPNISERNIENTPFPDDYIMMWEDETDCAIQLLIEHEFKKDYPSAYRLWQNGLRMVSDNEGMPDDF